MNLIIYQLKLYLLSEKFIQNLGLCFLVELELGIQICPLASKNPAK
jgi:hypothetical protein